MVEPSVQPISTTNDARSASSRRLVLLISGAIAIVLAGVAVWYLFGRDELAGFFPRGSEVYLSLADAGEVPLSSVSLSTENPGPVLVETGKDEKKYAIGIAKGNGVTYYLLLDPATLISNIYRQENDGTRTQISDTPTFKNHLSYDADTGTFVYQSVTAETPEDLADRRAWNIETFHEESGETKAWGQGIRPTFFSDDSVAVEENGLLYAVDLATGARERVAAVTSGVWALDASGTRLAVYDMNAQTIETFDLGGESLTSTGSYEVRYQPLVLTFVNDKPLALRVMGEGMLLALTYLDGRSIAFPNPYFDTALAPNQITLAYE